MYLGQVSINSIWRIYTWCTCSDQWRKPRVRDLYLGILQRKKVRKITTHFILVLQPVISDCKGANYLAGSYAGHMKMKCLVRDCDITSRYSDLEKYILCYHMHQKMGKILEEQLKDLSLHKLSWNGFDGIVMGSNAKYPQFGMILPEILHLSWIGPCD